MFYVCRRVCYRWGVCSLARRVVRSMCVCFRGMFCDARVLCALVCVMVCWLVLLCVGVLVSFGVCLLCVCCLFVVLARRTVVPTTVSSDAMLCYVPSLFGDVLFFE